MASISVTYTFTNSTTADASQVNTDFTDIINGTSDGTKDFNIGTLAVVGTSTFNGAVTLGDGSPDDITINGSLASSIPIKTNNSFNFGSSTLGLSSIYFGSAGGFTTRIVGGATSSWTMTLPTTSGTSGYALTNIGSGATAWSPVARGPYSTDNYGLSTSVGASAMTINLTDATGATPSATSPVTLVFKNSTASTGDATTLTVTSALSIVVNSGATLGHVSGANCYIYVWALNNAGTVELAVTGSRYNFDEGELQTTTGIGGGSTDWDTMYTTSSRTSKAVRLLGRIKSNQVTAGTYAANATGISLFGRQQWPDNTSWKSDLTFTPSTSFGTIGTSKIFYRRECDSIRVRGYFQPGTTTSSNAYISLPSISIDYSKLGTDSLKTHVGYFGGIYPSNPHVQINDANSGLMVVDGSDTGKVYLSLFYLNGSYEINHADTVSSGSTQWVDFEFSVPIMEWRSL